MQTNDNPDQVTLKVSPIDFEKGREALEQRGYVLTQCQTMQGYLLLTADRRQCTCQLCQSEAQQ